MHGCASGTTETGNQGWVGTGKYWLPDDIRRPHARTHSRSRCSRLIAAGGRRYWCGVREALTDGHNGADDAAWKGMIGTVSSSQLAAHEKKLYAVVVRLYGYNVSDKQFVTNYYSIYFMGITCFFLTQGRLNIIRFCGYTTSDKTFQVV